MEPKTLDVTSIEDAKEKISDIKVFGNGNLFKLVSKASSEDQGWMKGTKVLEVPNGCVIQVSTQQKNLDMTYSLAESLVFVPGVKLNEDGTDFVSIN